MNKRLLLAVSIAVVIFLRVRKARNLHRPNRNLRRAAARYKSAVESGELPIMTLSEYDSLVLALSHLNPREPTEQQRVDVQEYLDGTLSLD
jgi:hypothetical protein